MRHAAVMKFTAFCEPQCNAAAAGGRGVGGMYGGITINWEFISVCHCKAGYNEISELLTGIRNIAVRFCRINLVISARSEGTKFTNELKDSRMSNYARETARYVCTFDSCGRLIQILQVFILCTCPKVMEIVKNLMSRLVPAARRNRGDSRPKFPSYFPAHG